MIRRQQDHHTERRERVLAFVADRSREGLSSTSHDVRAVLRLGVATARHVLRSLELAGRIVETGRVRARNWHWTPCFGVTP